MKKGPNPRGKSRKHFKAKDGRSYDLYELIVKSIAENPPIMQLEFEDVQERIVKLLDDDSEKPKAQAIREHLTKLQELINGRRYFPGSGLERRDPLYSGPIIFILSSLGR